MITAAITSKLARCPEISTAGAPLSRIACSRSIPTTSTRPPSGVPCQVTYRAANNPYVDALIRQSRERYGIRLFAPKGDGTRELMAGMKRGDSIALLVDQKYNQGPEVTFFGQPVNASPGAARLAQKFDTVMQPLSVVRLPGVRFRVTAHEPIRVPDTGDKAADILAGIQAANAFVEDCVRAHPVDWFWVHKRWPDKVYAALREADQAT
jgi:KDO2-lipid IV(A) lauroyltransferase